MLDGHIRNGDVNDVADQDQAPLVPAAHDEVIQGGTISGLDQEVDWRPEKHHAETASRLALLLVWILVGTIAVHYVLVTVLSIVGIAQAPELLDAAFDKTLPVLAGFVGGAVTYYFTKDRKS